MIKTLDFIAPANLLRYELESQCVGSKKWQQAAYASNSFTMPSTIPEMMMNSGERLQMFYYECNKNAWIILRKILAQTSNQGSAERAKTPSKIFSSSLQNVLDIIWNYWT